jgi:NAD(P)-dependent dehydrogenase (short-subunit alcohol dehydrogenase family)
METQSLKGKVAIVTGSTSGIGLGVAHALASRGADLLLNGFGDKAQIDKLVADFKAQHKVKVGYSAADMSKPGDVAAMAYAAKHGLLGMTKVVALETATTGITCDAICPGWVLTPLVQKQIDERSAKEKIPVDRAKMDLLSEKQPSLEFATPEQIGAATVFLCSEGAAQIRGIALPVDGGWTAQ